MTQKTSVGKTKEGPTPQFKSLYKYTKPFWVSRKKVVQLRLSIKPVPFFRQA
jgi:hypothetical protein